MKSSLFLKLKQMFAWSSSENEHTFYGLNIINMARLTNVVKKKVCNCHFDHNVKAFEVSKRNTIAIVEFSHDVKQL